MSKNRKITIGVVVGVLVLIIAVLVFLFTSTSILVKFKSGGENNLGKFDSDFPAIETAFASREEAVKGGGGWYETMNETFDDNAMPDNWTQSPHGLRNYEYWCTNMVSFKDNQCVISSAKLDDNECTICPKSGYFTSGIETRAMVDEKSSPTWEQAFGYFEVRVKVPRTPGMWAAFWLQCDSMRQLGNGGKDGTEIDIFESAFIPYPNYVGHALHIDGYDDEHQIEDYIAVTDNDQYEGYHTYGLKWSPDSYVWYVDGVPTYATDFGGVSQVPEFLRLTCEIRKGGTWGPYGIKLSKFTGTRENPSEFLVDYVKVYQNTEFEKHIKSPDDFK